MIATPSTDAGVASPAPTGIVSGAILAERYKLLELLGEGAMGAVWLAEHVHMRKRFAIKVLHTEAVGSSELVARFEREAVAAGNINHPGVAAATDFGRLADGSFFLVLEYVAGKDLRWLVHQGALHPARALHLTRQILDALGAAHATGVVHRDVKPENVMLVAQPVGHELEDFVKILDFGIAKLDANSHGEAAANPLTRMGAVYGTPAYMAPEQAMGMAIDGRADLYAVGVMLYEMVHGKPPFEGDPIVIIAKQVNEPAPALTSPWAQSAITLPLIMLVETLMAKDREARPADAAAAIALVDAAIGATPGDPRLGLIGSAATVFGDSHVTAAQPMVRAQTIAHRIQTLAFRAKRGAQILAHDTARKVGIPYRQFLIVAGVIGALLFALVCAIAWPRSKERARVDSNGSSQTTKATSTTASAAPTAKPAPSPMPTWLPTAPASAASPTPSASGSPSAKKPQHQSGGFVGKLKSIFH